MIKFKFWLDKIVIPKQIKTRRKDGIFAAFVGPDSYDYYHSKTAKRKARFRFSRSLVAIYGVFIHRAQIRRPTNDDKSIRGTV